jgi:hypothetical protein
MFLQRGDSSVWGMFLMNVVLVWNDFWHILYVIHTAQQACHVYTVSKAVFKMEATVHWIMLATAYRQSAHLETWSASVSIHSTAAGSRPYTRIYRPMKYKQYSWPHCTDWLCIPYSLLSSGCVGSFLEVKLPDCEADQKCYLLRS